MAHWDLIWGFLDKSIRTYKLPILEGSYGKWRVALNSFIRATMHTLTVIHPHPHPG